MAGSTLQNWILKKDAERTDAHGAAAAAGLFIGVVAEAGERRYRNTNLHRLLTGRPCERRVHDHEVHRLVLWQERIAPPPAFDLEASEPTVNFDARVLEQSRPVLNHKLP